jgi:hypothetical protein
LRWVALLGNVARKVSLWINSYGDEPFRMTGARSTNKHVANVLQELTSMQALLVMRIKVTDNFGEFKINGEDLVNLDRDTSEESIISARSAILERLEKMDKF